MVIVGLGGLSREIHSYFSDVVTGFTVSSGTNLSELYGLPIYKDFASIPKDNPVIIAIGDPLLKEKVVEQLGGSILFPNLVFHNAFVGKDVEIGKGVVICPNCALSANIKVGDFVLINLNSTVGHDCIIGDFVNIAPGSNISGNCTIGDRVYVGSNSVIREKISICSDVTIGMGSVVVKDIVESGTYVGNPCKKIR